MTLDAAVPCTADQFAQRFWAKVDAESKCVTRVFSRRDGAPSPSAPVDEPQHSGGRQGGPPTWQVRDYTDHGTERVKQIAESRCAARRGARVSERARHPVPRPARVPAARGDLRHAGAPAKRRQLPRRSSAASPAARSRRTMSCAAATATWRCSPPARRCTASRSTRDRPAPARVRDAAAAATCAACTSCTSSATSS